MSNISMAYMHEVRIFVILHLRVYFLSLTAFCMQKMIKIPQTVEEISIKQTVSTFSLLFLMLV